MRSEFGQSLPYTNCFWLAEGACGFNRSLADWCANYRDGFEPHISLGQQSRRNQPRRRELGARGCQRTDRQPGWRAGSRCRTSSGTGSPPPPARVRGYRAVIPWRSTPRLPSNLVFGPIGAVRNSPCLYRNKAVFLFQYNRKAYDSGLAVSWHDPYKSLAQVERAFRSMKTIDLQVRPIYHFSESRVRAHVFLCMLAYYVEWHLRQALKPLLHDDEDLATLRDQRANPVMPTPRSEGADAKAARHRTDDDLPVHSLQTLLQDLATLTYNITSTSVNPQTKIVITTRPTPLQRKAFALLGIDPGCSQ